MVSREHILLPPGYGTCMLVAAADTTAADYPGDNRQMPLLPAAAGRPGRSQASQGSPRVCGG